MLIATIIATQKVDHTAKIAINGRNSPKNAQKKL
jgi:hypothetical protein